MAPTYNYSGIYTDETVHAPPFITSVAAAIPCFIGVTQIAGRDGDLLDESYKINSFAEYEALWKRR